MSRPTGRHPSITEPVGSTSFLGLRFEKGPPPDVRPELTAEDPDYEWRIIGLVIKDGRYELHEYGWRQAGNAGLWLPKVAGAPRVKTLLAYAQIPEPIVDLPELPTEAEVMWARDGTWRRVGPAAVDDEQCTMRQAAFALSLDAYDVIITKPGQDPDEVYGTPEEDESDEA